MNSDSQNIEDFKRSFFEIISESKKVVITAHISPDDDSIASVLSTYTILSREFPDKDIKILYSGPKVERYNIFF